MRTQILILVGLLVFALAAPTLAKDGPLSELEEIVAKPPASGFLITQVMPMTQAAEVGMKAGDIITAYGGRPVVDIQTLGAAKQAFSEGDSLEVKVFRRGRTLTMKMTAGQIGVNGLGVEKGVPGPVLPAGTGVTFDFSSLRAGPQDVWTAFTFDGANKVGFEHGVLRLRGDTLILRRETAFDGGEQWGLNHFDVRVILEVSPRLRVLVTRFLNPITGWLGTGKRFERESGGAEWRAAWPEAEPRTERLPADALPTNFVEHLAHFMPREKGACYRFTPLNEGFGQLGLPSALVCDGRDEVEVRGEVKKAWRYRWVQLGGVVSGTYWVDDAGVTVLVNYGGPLAFPVSKAEALSGLHEGIKPRSAD